MTTVWTRDAVPSDAAALVGILNPIIEARVFTAFDTPFTVVGTARKHAKIDGRYVDEVLIERHL